MNDTQKLIKKAEQKRKELGIRTGTPEYFEFMESVGTAMLELQRSKHPTLSNRELTKLTIMEIGN